MSSSTMAPACAVALLLALTGSAFAQRRTAAPSAMTLEALPPAVREAVAVAYREAAARPRDPAAASRLAMLLHAHEQHETAAWWYARARKLDPTSAALAYLSGVVQGALGDHRSAAASFRAALQIDADALPARLRLAESLIESSDLDAGEAELAALVERFPELAIAHYGLGRIASLRGNAAMAAERFARAIGLAPEFGAAHYALALAYRDAGAADRAAVHLAAYRGAPARRPWVPDPLIDQVRALRRTARELLAEAARLEESGRIPEAIALQLRALEADPAAAQAHVNLIALYGRTGRPAEAEAHYREAVKRPDAPADAHYNYGVLLASQGRHEDALAAFRRTLATDPFHAAAHNNLAALLVRQGQDAEAAAHYRQALANDPMHPTARLNLGRVLLRLGRRSEAAGVLASALDRAERQGDAALAAAIRRELEKATARQ